MQNVHGVHAWHGGPSGTCHATLWCVVLRYELCKCRWPQLRCACGCADAGDEGVQPLQYEVLMPGGWHRGRKQKGIVKLGTVATSFATVAISAVPVSGGRVATPTLIVLPPQQQPVRGGSVWMDVAEAR